MYRPGSGRSLSARYPALLARYRAWVEYPPSVVAVVWQCVVKWQFLTVKEDVGVYSAIAGTVRCFILGTTYFLRRIV